MKKLWIPLFAGLVIISAGWLVFWMRTPGKYDDFAKCLKDKGTIFYGAFWCPHCQNQKKLFGKSQKYLPYVECSTPDGKSQTKECIDKGIQSYPIWEFPGGGLVSGEVSLSTLAEKTTCILPQ